MEAVRVEKVELHLLPFIPAALKKFTHTQKHTGHLGAQADEGIGNGQRFL